MRVKAGAVTTRRRRKIIKAAKGYVHGRSKLYRLAKQATMKAGTNAATDRKLKKRDFRSIWIVRLNNALKNMGLRYNSFIKDKNDKQILLNRKILSELAINKPDLFNDLVTKISSSPAASKPKLSVKKKRSEDIELETEEKAPVKEELEETEKAKES